MNPKATAVVLIEYQNDFTTEGVTLKDCTATLSEEEQHLSVEKNYPMFSRVMTHTEFLEALAGEHVAAGSGREYNQ